MRVILHVNSITHGGGGYAGAHVAFCREKKLGLRRLASHLAEVYAKHAQQ